MTRRIDPPTAAILLSCAAAAVLLLPLRNFVAAFPLLPFAAALALFLAPGALLTRLAFREVRGLAALPVAFALSTGMFGLLGVPFLISHRSVEAYLWAAGAALAASVLIAIPALLVPGGPPDTGRREGGSGGWLWLAFGLLGGILAFLSTRRVPASSDDIWVYLAWVRHFAGAERLALYEPYHGEPTAGLSRVQVNGWLLEQAALARVSGIDTIEFVLRYWTPALVVVALLAVYALARILFRDERLAVACGAVYALFHLAFIQPSVHNVGAELVARIPEDKHAARFLILPVALLCAVLFVRERKRRYLGFFAFLCWTVVAVHPVVLPALGLSLVGFGLAHVGAHPLRREPWTGMAALALALWSVLLGPLLLLLSGRSPAAVLYSADINSTPPEILDNLVFVMDSWRHIHVLDDGSYIMHPWLILNPVIASAYLLGVPFLMRRTRESLAAQLLLGGLLVVAAAVYVPPVATFVGENLVIPGQLWRLAWPIPLLALLTVGWMLWEGLAYARDRLGERRVSRLLPYLLAGALVAAVVPASVARGVDLYRAEATARSSDYDPDPIHPWIQANIREPSVLLAPNDANTSIPAYTTSVDVVSLRGEAIIDQREELQRSAGSEIEIPRRALDVHAFFHDSTAAERRTILRRYGADYLLLPAGSTLHGDLEGESGLRPVEGAPRERYVLYRVDPRELGP